MTKIIKHNFSLSIFFRKIYSPIIFWVLRLTKYRKIKDPKKWDDFKKLDIYSFQNEILQYPYKKDYVDNTIQYPDFFFSEKEGDRDCDDFAFVWKCWAIENGYSPIRYVVWQVDSEGKESRGHVFTIFKDFVLGKYILADYFCHFENDTIDKCLEIIVQKYGYENEMHCCVY